MRNADTVRGLNRGIGRPLHRYTSLESGVMRKYHAPFGGRPTEKGSNQEYLAGGPPYPISSGGTAHSPLPRLGRGAITSVPFEFRGTYSSRDGRCATSTFKGMNGALTSR